MSQQQTISTNQSKVLLGLLVLCVLLGLSGRLLGIFSDFWLDEIWSLNAVKSLNSPLEIFTKVQSDNNHILNSLYLYLIGDTSAWYLYRIFSLLCGLAALYLCWKIADKWGALSRNIVLVFCSLSYLLVLYASEARGYSALVLFSLLAYLAADRILDETNASLKSYSFFWLFCILAFLSHFSFISFYLCLFINTLFLAKKQKNSLVFLAKMHLIPVAFILFIYFVHIQYLPPGTGPLKAYLEVIINALSVSFGGPEMSILRLAEGVAVVLLALFVIICSLIELFLQRKEKDKDFLFFSLVIFIMPLCILVVFQPRVIFIRYFLLSSVFVYFLIARFFVRVSKASLGGKALSAFAIVLFVLANGQYLYHFLQDGRGNYKEAVSYVLSHSTKEPISIGSDQDFRNPVVFRYYAEILGSTKRFNFVSQATQLTSSIKPEWYLVQNQDHRNIPQKELRIDKDSLYILEKTYLHTALSGWTWYLYRLSNAT